MEEDREPTLEDYRRVFGALFFILTIVFAWRGFDFYRNNSGQIFFDDLREGLAAFFSANWHQSTVDNIAMLTGWSHPAFGICCVVPLIWIFFKLSYIFDVRDL
jgi:hypothetical protein